MTKQQSNDIILLSNTQHKGGENVSTRIHTPYNRLKIWLKDNGITYSEIAQLLGRTETSIMFKINGKSDFTLSEIQLLKSTYKINTDIFFTDDVA